MWNIWFILPSRPTSRATLEDPALLLEDWELQTGDQKTGRPGPGSARFQGVPSLESCQQASGNSSFFPATLLSFRNADSFGQGFQRYKYHTDLKLYSNLCLASFSPVHPTVP